MGIIGSIRKHSWIAVTIVGIAIIAFIIGDLTKRNGNNDTDVAVINGKTLKRSQFEKMVEQEVNYYRVVREGASLSSAEERSIRDSIWANYLDDIVLGEEFKKLGLEVSDAEMNDMATGTFIHPWFANQRGLYDENGSYSRTQANNMLKYYSSSNNAIERYGWEQQMELLKKDRLRQKYVTLVTSGFYMPNAIAKQITDYSAQGATVGVVCMPYNQVADNELTLTPEDYQNYYDKHKEEFRNMNEELRVLEYVAFDIVPSAKDFATAEDSANVIWSKIQATSDSASRALENMVRKYSKGVAKYTYDSTYNRYLPASYFMAPFSERVASAEVGNEISPMLIGDKWFMGRVLDIDHRPDSIRTSVLFVMTQEQRDSLQTAALADSLMRELNAGRLNFDTAVVRYCDIKYRKSMTDSLGDMAWLGEGYFDYVFESTFNSRGEEPVFKGINEKIVSTPVGGQFLFSLPKGMGYVIVKVTDKSAPVKKYRMAMVVQKVKASNETINEIQKEAYEFLSECHNGKDFDQAYQKYRKEPRTIRVYRTNNRVTLGRDFMNGVEMVNYLNNMGDVVKWAFNETTKVGDVNIDIKLDRSYEPARVRDYRRKNEAKENSVDMIGVARLKEVYAKGYLTLDQVRAIPEYNFERLVRIEKRKEILMARAENLAKNCKSINDVAAQLNDSVRIIDSVGIFANTFDGFGMEPKVQSMAAMSKSNGLMGPIQGANGIYFVQVQQNGRYEIPTTMQPDQFCMGYEMNLRRSYGRIPVEWLHQNDDFYARFNLVDDFFADWNVRRYMPSVTVIDYQNQRMVPYSTNECRLTQWLRAQTPMVDQRD